MTGVQTCALPIFEELGDEVHKKYAYFSHFKMELFKNKGDSKIKSHHNGIELSVSKVIADHIKLMLADIKDFINKKYKHSIDISKASVYLTVPAIWTEKLKNLMKNIAFNSGLIRTKHPSDEEFQVVLEPEAAVLTSVHESIEDNQPFPKVPPSLLLTLAVAQSMSRCTTMRNRSSGSSSAQVVALMDRHTWTKHTGRSWVASSVPGSSRILRETILLPL